MADSRNLQVRRCRPGFSRPEAKGTRGCPNGIAVGLEEDNNRSGLAQGANGRGARRLPRRCGRGSRVRRRAYRVRADRPRDLLGNPRACQRFVACAWTRAGLCGRGDQRSLESIGRLTCRKPRGSLLSIVAIPDEGSGLREPGANCRAMSRLSPPATWPVLVEQFWHRQRMYDDVEGRSRQGHAAEPR